MQLKAGYKLTQVGLIPKEWQVSQVGREFDIQLGKMLDAAKNQGIPKPYLGNKAVQWKQINIKNFPTMLMSPSDCQRFRLRRGDLLVCEGGEIGRAAIWEAPLEECYYQKALHRLPPLYGFNPYLMLAYLRYWTSHDMLANYVSQTSIAHLTKEKLAKVSIPVPNQEEQQAIVSALNDVDALISALDKLIAKKYEIKQATMQQLLTGKMRLPGFEGAWEVKPLGELFEITAGGDFEPLLSSDNRDEKYCYPIYSNTISGSGRHGFCSYNAHQANSITITARGTLGIANFRDHPFTAIGRVVVLRQKSPLDGRFLTEFINNRIDFVTQSTGVPQLTAPQTAKYDVLLPPLSEQRAIAAILSDMDAEMLALEGRREKTRLLKQGMMKELLTGKTRLV